MTKQCHGKGQPGLLFSQSSGLNQPLPHILSRSMHLPRLLSLRLSPSPSTAPLPYSSSLCLPLAAPSTLHTHPPGGTELTTTVCGEDNADTGAVVPQDTVGREVWLGVRLCEDARGPLLWAGSWMQSGEPQRRVAVWQVMRTGWQLKAN